MQALAAEPYVTYEDYLAAEELSPVKHEYWDGHVYAMAGTTPPHAQITFNLSASIGPRLRGKRCRGASSDQRVRIEKSNVALYPDVSILCPPEKYSEQDKHAITNPIAVIEVLSPSTEKYDRGEKFEQYSLIPELTDYLLVSQERILVEHFARGSSTLAGDEWILRRFNSREDIIPLPHLEIDVPLDEIYDGLDLPSGLVAMRTPPAAQE